MATAHQKAFGRAARKCGGRGGKHAFRACMRKELGGKKSRSKRRHRR